MKVDINLLDRNGVSEPQLSFSTISAEFERVEVWLHEFLIKSFNVTLLIYFLYLNKLNVSSPILQSRDNKLLSLLKVQTGYCSSISPSTIYNL